MSRTNKMIIAALAVILAIIVAVLALNIPEKAEQPPVETEAPVPTETPNLNYGVGTLVINEFMEKNRAVIMDEDGEFSDWIELRNVSGEDIDLTGWTIADEDDGGWTMPDMKLGAGEILLLFASGKDRQGVELHTDFALSGKETIYLRNAAGTVIDSAKCMDCSADVSVVRGDDGGFSQAAYATPGYENTEEGYEAFQQTLVSSAPLQINEVVVHNRAGYEDPYRGHCDWLEIKNTSHDVVSTAGYYLSDSHKNYKLWAIPETELDPGEILLILCDGSGTDTPAGLHCASFSLSSDGEQLFLTDPDGSIADRAVLRNIPDGCSYGRTEDQPGWFYFDRPSLDAENRGGARFIGETPVTLTKDGIYNDVESVTVELSGKGTLRYTLDGSLPTAHSEVYTEPLTLTQTTVVRAVSFVDGALPSRPLTASYIINENHTLPVLSLATDDLDGFNRMNEFMQKGIEQAGTLSMYEQDGSGFTIGCGISLNGETSLVMLKKNMSLRFRGSYGDDTLKYDLYGGGVTEFSNLLLRAGQDQISSIVKNELCQELCAKASDNVINQRSIWGVLYVNGKYAGLYTLKEKQNEQHYANLAGVSRDSVELEEANVSFKSDIYQNVIYFCVMNDMTKPKNYKKITDQVDIDSLIDWAIIESACSNLDLTSGNLRFVRSSENDGKWRLMFYDLDATFQSTGGIYVSIMSDYAKATRQIGALLVPLMQNEEFRDRFLKRAAELLSTTLTDEAILEELDRQCAIVAPEVPRDMQRLHRTEEDWKKTVNNIREVMKIYDWNNYQIDTLCRLFDLTKAERAQYFGAWEKNDRNEADVPKV